MSYIVSALKKCHRPLATGVMMATLSLSALLAEDLGVGYEGAASDLAQTVKKFESTPYYKIYQVLSQGPLAPHIEKLMSEAREGIRHKTPLTLDQWLAAFAAVSFEAQLQQDGELNGQSVLRFHHHEELLWGLLTSRFGQPAEVQAVDLPGGASLARGKDEEGRYWRLLGPGFTSDKLADNRSQAGGSDLWYKTQIDVARIKQGMIADADIREADGVALVSELMKLFIAADVVTAESTFDVNPDGFVTQVSATGLRPDLPALDPEVFQALPAETMVLMATRFNGDLFDQFWTILNAHHPRSRRELTRANQELEAMGLPNFSQIAKSITGTAFFAVSPAVPFPAGTLALPRSAEVDQVIQFVAAQAAVDLTTVATQPVTIPLPNAPIVLFAQQSADHWLLSNDQATLEALLRGENTFAASRVYQTMKQQGFAAHALMAIDYQQLVSAGQSYLPLALMNVRDPEFKGILSQLMVSLPQLIPHLPLGYMAVGKDGDSARYYDQNGIFLASSAAGLTLPAINQARSKARQMEFGNNLKQLYVLSMARYYDKGEFPMTMQQVVEENAVDVRPKILAHPYSDIAEPYIFIRPVGSVSSRQIVLLENPEINNYRETVAIMGDSSMTTDPLEQLRQDYPDLDYQKLWRVAKQLSLSEKARTMGISMDDWNKALAE